MFQKLREAALAYHLTRKYSKEQILRDYLNTIYFGNGAYGIEAAARTYFQPYHPGCDEPGRPLCASQLAPHEAALLAGMIASPSAYDPIANPDAARDRRDLVLRYMRDQELLTPAAVPGRDRAGAARARRPPAAGGGHRLPVLHVLDQAAGRRPAGRRPGGRAAGLRGRPERSGPRSTASCRRPPSRRSTPGCPTATARAPRSWRSTTDTRQVRAMVGGDDYNETPFNLATQGQRQPGSAIKPFILAEALRQGISPELGLGLEEDDLRRAEVEGDLHRQQLRGRLLRHHHPRARDDLLRQLGVRAGRHQDRHAQDRAAGRAHGHPQQRLDQLRDDARRAQGGRLAARHGARLRDVRQRRRPRLRHAQPGRRQPARRPRAGSRRHHAGSSTGRRRRLDGGHADERRAR